MLYTERHKNLKPYRITRGSITRDERNEKGTVVSIRYGVGDTIMLTEEGAARIPGVVAVHSRGDGVIRVQDTTPKDTTDEPVKRVAVPDDWESMRKADMLALAATISGTPVKKVSDAHAIIEAYVMEKLK